MAGRKELLKDEAARSVGKALGFAPLIGIAGLIFGLSLTTHRTPVIVASAIAIVVPFVAALIAGRDPSPAKPQAVPAPPVRDPSTVPAAVVAPATVERVKADKVKVEPEPVKTGATGAKAVETTVMPSGNGAQAEAAAEPKNGKAKATSVKPELNKPKKDKKAKKDKKKKK